MGWIKKSVPVPAHWCEPPLRGTGNWRDGHEIAEPDGGVPGDLWQCDECGMVWEITSVDRDGYSGQRRWRKAAWFTQRRYRKLQRRPNGWMPPRTGGYTPTRRGEIDPVDDRPFPEGKFPPKGGGGVSRPHVILRTTAEAGADTSTED